MELVKKKGEVKWIRRKTIGDRGVADRGNTAEYEEVTEKRNWIGLKVSRDICDKKKYWKAAG